MSEIRVNTNDLRMCSQDLNNSANELGNIQSRLNNATAGVGNAYDGQLKRSVDGVIGGSFQTTVNLQNRSFDLGHELAIRANGFETANQAGASAMLRVSSQINNDTSSSPFLRSNGTLDPSKENRANTIFNMVGLIGAFGLLISRSIVDVADFAKDIPYSSFVTDGRNLNKLVGNSRAGFVGVANDAGHFLKNSTNQSLFMGAGVLFGIADDLKKGDNLNRAVGSELIEFAVDMGVSAIPLVGEVYLGYKIGMTGLKVSVGILDLFGQKENARWLENTLDTYDYPELIGDAVYDFVANPPTDFIPSLKHQVVSQFGY